MSIALIGAPRAQDGQGARAGVPHHRVPEPIMTSRAPAGVRWMPKDRQALYGSWPSPRSPRRSVALTIDRAVAPTLRRAGRDLPHRRASPRHLRGIPACRDQLHPRVGTRPVARNRDEDRRPAVGFPTRMTLQLPSGVAAVGEQALRLLGARDEDQEILAPRCSLSAHVPFFLTGAPLDAAFFDPFVPVKETIGP